MEIIVCLLLAGLIGFVLGWVVRDGIKNKSLDKIEKPSSKETEKTNIEETGTKEISISSPTLLIKARDEGKDNLSLIKGIGPILEDKLNKLGIYHLDQIALWSREEQAWIDAQILFPKKVEREEWVKQATELSQQ